MSGSTTVLERASNPIEASRAFLGRLLDERIVDYLIVPQEIPDGSAVVPTLVADSTGLSKPNPFAPVAGVNAARVVSRLTFKNPRRRIGAVLRPCEIRATIELVKLRQASLDNLLVIGVDCPGTYPVGQYTGAVSNGKDGEAVTLELLEALRSRSLPPSNGLAARFACQICEHFVPENADISILTFGVDGPIAIEFRGGIDGATVEKLGEPVGRRTGRREEVVVGLAARAARRRAQACEELQARMEDPSGLLSLVSNCVVCHNCRVACPICYCRECLFDSPTFRHEPEQLLRWSERKGAIRMPSDTLLYHITRMNHMITSCVGCGQCMSACPNDVPILKLFPLMAEEVQKTFDYVAGRSVSDPLPLATFREEELMPR